MKAESEKQLQPKYLSNSSFLYNLTLGKITPFKNMDLLSLFHWEGCWIENIFMSKSTMHLSKYSRRTLRLAVLIGSIKVIHILISRFIWGYVRSFRNNTLGKVMKETIMLILIISSVHWHATIGYRIEVICQ